MKVYQKSHHQLALSVWIFDCDQSVDGLTVIYNSNYNSNEYAWTNKTE